MHGEITVWHWTGFVAAVVVLLALDLGVFHRRPHEVRFREALGWTGFWVLIATGFGLWMYFGRSRDDGLEFLTGYLIELSLSMDNVFVIALIFSYFGVPLRFQHRVLFWGILGAIVMRGVMIGAGAALIQQFHWLLYVLGAFLIITGLKMLFGGDTKVEPERNPVLRLARKLFPVTTEFDGQKFVTRREGQRVLTPMALVLIMVETTDLVFALDSIPAIFAVTQDEFIVFTSNVFAILGLRSLYFALAGAIAYFRYLKVGLSLVLVFIGVKMLLGIWNLKIDIGWALGVVGTILVASILASWIAGRHGEKAS
ncbi:MAG: TerC family protein [Verrucomicrobiales bacterium]|nr:TerC family protein [Verrucomicrobiales bacterium]